MTIFWNSNQQRLRAGWRIVICFIVMVLLTVIISTIGGTIAGVLFGFDQLVNVTIGSPLGAFFTTLTLVATLLTLFIMARWIDRRPFWEYTGRINPQWWLDLAAGLLLGVLLMALIFAVQLLLGWVTVTGTFVSGSIEPFLLSITLPLITFLAVGIYEELIVRGYLLTNLAEGLHGAGIGAQGATLIAWGISSVVFGILHALNPNATLISTFNLMLAGLFLGLAYILTGSLALPIGLHIAWNFAQGNLFGFPVSGNTGDTATVLAIAQGGPDLITGGAFGPEAGLIGIAAMLLGSGLIVAYVYAGQRPRPLAVHQPIAAPPAVPNMPSPAASSL